MTAPGQPDLVQRIADAIPTALTATPHVGLGSARRLKIAAAVMPVVQAELDAKDAEIAEARAYARYLDEEAIKPERALHEETIKRAEQAEELLRIAHDTSNRSEAERARAVQRAEAAEDENRKLTAQLTGYQRDVERMRAYHQQIGDL